MNEETRATDATEPEGPLAGQRLAAARRDREISIHEIAKELHLDEPKVQALEENRFDVLGAPVFAKGHLRKYAELVGVSVDDVLADYYAMNRAVGAPPVVRPPAKPEREIRIGRWVGIALLVAAVAAAAYWWISSGMRISVGAGDAEPAAADVVVESISPVADSMTADAPADSPALDVAAAPEETEAEVLEEIAEPPPAADTAAEEPEATNIEAVSRSLPSTGGPRVTLGMTFSGDCWTEVTDSAGQRLFFDLGRAGRTVSVSGEAPLRVLFGNADNVSVTVNGDDYPIAASARRGETARFSVNAQ